MESTELSVEVRRVKMRRRSTHQNVMTEKIRLPDQTQSILGRLTDKMDIVLGCRHHAHGVHDELLDDLPPINVVITGHPCIENEMRDIWVPGKVRWAK